MKINLKGVQKSYFDYRKNYLLKSISPLPVYWSVYKIASCHPRESRSGGYITQT